jgi:hypothetical protein
MMAASKLNLHGLKRLHRHQSDKCHYHGLCITNYAQDYGMNITIPAVKGGFTSTNLKDHFTKFIPKLEQDVEKLRKLNSDYCEAQGIMYDEGVHMQKCLSKKWMKMKFRWLPRFEFTKWSPEDIVSWDKWLHDKTRCKEEHEGGKHNCPYCHQHAK